MSDRVTITAIAHAADVVSLSVGRGMWERDVLPSTLDDLLD